TIKLCASLCHSQASPTNRYGRAPLQLNTTTWCCPSLAQSRRGCRRCNGRNFCISTPITGKFHLKAIADLHAQSIQLIAHFASEFAVYTGVAKIEHRADVTRPSQISRG